MTGCLIYWTGCLIYWTGSKLDKYRIVYMECQESGSHPIVPKAWLCTDLHRSVLIVSQFVQRVVARLSSALLEEKRPIAQARYPWDQWPLFQNVVSIVFHFKLTPSDVSWIMWLCTIMGYERSSSVHPSCLSYAVVDWMSQSEAKWGRHKTWQRETVVSQIQLKSTRCLFLHDVWGPLLGMILPVVVPGLRKKTKHL